MSNFTSTSDLLKGALDRAGEVTNGNSPYHAKCLKYINQIYYNILAGANELNVDMGELWPWALSSSPKILNLTPKYTGSVSLTKASTSGTLSATVAVSLVDYVFKLDGHPDKYRISAHTAGTAAITLDGEFNGETDSYTYTAGKIRYSLGSDVLRLVEPFRVYRDSKFPNDRDGKIYGIDSISFRRDFPMKNILATIPTRFFVGYASDRSQYVEFNAYADTDRIRVELDYIPVPTALVDSDNSIPVIPLVHRPVLEFGAAYMVLADKGDSKSALYLELTKSKMIAMKTDLDKQHSNTSRDRARLIPRLEDYRPTTIEDIWI